MDIYEIDIAYLEYLSQCDDKVRIEHLHRKTRKYIGVLFTIDDYKYFAPMSSPKPKHHNIHSSAPDIYKIKNGVLGVININNMIPIKNDVAYIVDIESVTDTQYKQLLQKQIRELKLNKDFIIKKAKKLYKMITESKRNDNGFQILKQRCCDFSALEQYLLNYLK